MTKRNKFNFQLKIYLALLLGIYFGNVNAQVLVSRKLIDSVKIDAVNFLKREKYFNKEDSFEDCNKRIFFSELADESLLGYREFGLYVFGVTTSHTERFILIFDTKDWKIRSVGDLKPLLTDAVDFFNIHKTTDKEILIYVKRIAETYEYNHKF